MKSLTPPPASYPEPLFVADDLALDFINTRFGVGERHREYFGSDGSVLQWLRRTESITAVSGEVPKARSGTLVKAAIELRESARDLVACRKAERVGNPSVLNRFLALDRSTKQLEWRQGKRPTLRLQRHLLTVEAVLVPVANAVAALLTEGDFQLVRTCESADCTLWFYDRTKAHHRRWCSMALCGNRAKVASFRARQGGVT
jgi:predicted RNA-binding Zn ribbon-like protein